MRMLPLENIYELRGAHKIDMFRKLGEMKYIHKKSMHILKIIQ